MEDLNVDDLIAGLGNAAYEEHHVMLLQLMANMVGEEVDIPTTQKVQSFAMVKLRDTMRKNDVEQLDLMFIVLSNLTAMEANCEAYLEYLAAQPAAMAIFKAALHRFLGIDSKTGRVIESSISSEDPYQKMASLLCNITRMEPGRKLLLDRHPPCCFPHIIELMKSDDYTRRKGAVGCVRNCLYDSDFHFWMVFELNILNSILRPLVVNTPFTEKEKIGMNPEFVQLADNPETRPERDVEIVKLLMECVLLLCQKRWSRQHLRTQKVYPICRNLDYFLEDDKVNDVMLEIVNFLERDDDPTEVDDIPPIPTTSSVSVSDAPPQPPASETSVPPNTASDSIEAAPSLDARSFQPADDARETPSVFESLEDLD